MLRSANLRRRGAETIAAVLMLSSLLVAISPGTARAELPALADETWGVVGVYDSISTSGPAEVMALEQIGNTIYIGGQFLEVVRRRNDPHHDQPFLAAFDATSGAFIDWWRPELNGSVFALEASPDGSRLYVGGEFTEVNGIGDTAGMVALDPATGEVDLSFTAQFDGAPGAGTPGAVRTIRAIGNHVYVGGSFNYVTGPDRSSRIAVSKVTRLAATTGTPDPTWRPEVRDGGVWGLDVDPSRNRVYIVGFFQSIGGVADTSSYAAVRISDATPITGLTRIPNLSPNQHHKFEILVDRDTVWMVGAQHVFLKLNADDLSIDRRWFTGFAEGYHIGGDFQAMGILGDRIYATCHCFGVIRELADDVTTLDEARIVTPILGEVRGIIGFDRATGDWIPTWMPDIRGQIGGFALLGAADGCLWAGGDFNRRVDGDLWRNGVVRYCDEAGQGPPVAPPLTPPPPSGDTSPPTRPAGLAATPAAGGNVILSWLPATDDTAVATYLVYRDGAEMARTRRTELLAPAGGVYSVVAVDTSGNTSGFSDPVVTVATAPALLAHWPLDSGARDMTVHGNDGVVTGAENIPGRIVDAQRLGAGDSIAVAANPEINPGAGDSDFSVSAWLRLESAGDGTPRAHVAVAGVVTIGTTATNRIGATVTRAGGAANAESADPLAVGDWAHVAVVRRGGNVELYLDGTLETTVPLGGPTSGGNGAVTLTGNTASVDDVMIHDGALAAAAIADMAAPDFPESLWAYYPFDGDTADHSGNGFHGVASGTTTQPAVHGSGVAFDAAGPDRITIAADPALRPGDNHSDFTVAFWMNLQEGFTGENRVITQKGSSNDERTFAMWMRRSDNRLRYRLSTDRAINIGGNSNSWIPVGDWTHVAYVKRGNRLTLYLNGVADSSAQISGLVLANDGNIHIGDTDWAAATSMLIDDYRIYAYGMQTDEVAALSGFASPALPPPPPLPPVVAIAAPSSGPVAKTVQVAVEASSPIDAMGTLDVDVNVGNGWQQATWDTIDERYEWSWDTRTATPGPATVRARATDSSGMTTTADPVAVDVKADYPTLVLDDGAVAYWRLNDGGRGAYDWTGTGHRAYYLGPTTRTAPLIGEGGRSATFDGVDDIIAVADHRDLNTAASYDARTIELWFTSNSAPRRQILWEEGGSAHGISVYVDNGRIHAGAWKRTGADAWGDVFVKTRFTPGETYHVVVTVRPGGYLKLFVNGERAAYASGVGPIAAHSGNIGIGARAGAARFADIALSGGRGNFLDGVIDEVAIYNTVLTKTQIVAHYTAAQD